MIGGEWVCTKCIRAANKKAHLNRAEVMPHDDAAASRSGSVPLADHAETAPTLGRH